MKTTIHRILAALVVAAATASAEPASLKQSGDIGRVSEVQGVASVRAQGGQRWSLATPGLPLKPGDWVRTDGRGANVLRLRLASGGDLTLGPGTVVEVRDGASFGLTSGEIEATAAKAELLVLPAEGKSYAIRAGERKLFRRQDGRGVELLEKDPKWLLGFKGAATTESMGSLLATVDGRNTPLTLGYHKVTVDIRDQIARTVIEESFVNHTDGRLEGVFYFPLPQDASIAGFGMWIDGELVEADVVEKQRAREIYETILRERRDPGLLEWTGGNIFKARVFPILPHAEKRVKITYTQVLPLKNGGYRYRYALQSEMLRENPLRELSLNVRVASALPITGISCGTHPARVEHTAHAAQAEFTAQEYTPDKDFELDIALDAAAAPVVVIPHRRGEDGYFLALVTPPGGQGGWQSERGLVPDGEPLHLVIVADTSGSMDATARANQDALIGALLSSLGDNDRFELATCDNTMRWFKPDDGVKGAAAVTAAREFVAARTSLGWTDLDRTFAAIGEHVRGKAKTQVIYIGDGVITTGDADPVAFANRLQRLCGDCGATFHAVAPSSRYEPGVLKAIAAIGGGTRRRIEGSDTPAKVAADLLDEMVRPGLRDLKVAFKGLRVARVYPEELPNLPAGEQQIVIGRYLPEGTDQRGEIVVTGVRDGREERFSAPVVMADAEAENSFIPRLWARMYLDVLLEQGTSQAIKDEIIALSEEYKIMTPYTSFLVLENDADRERFKVKRRFEMRDGERFFAAGRDTATEELLAKQLRLAGSWRMNLRQAFLREVGTMGREDYRRLVAPRGYSEEVRYKISGASTYSGSTIVSGGVLPGYSFDGFVNYGHAIGSGAAADRSDWYENGAERSSGFKDLIKAEGFDDDGDKTKEEKESLDLAEEPMDRKADEQPAEWDGELKFEVENRVRSELSFAGKPQSAPAQPSRFRVAQRPMLDRLKSLGGDRGNMSYDYAGNYHWRNRVQDLQSLFPTPIESSAKPARAPKHPWPQAARDLADSLLRSATLAAREDGVRISIKQTSFDPRRSVETSRSQTEALLSRQAWFVRTAGDRRDTQLDWWRDGGERGRLLLATGLGRTRPGEPADRTGYPSFLADFSLASLADGSRHLSATVRKLDDNRVELTLADAEKKYISVYEIDAVRKVVLSVTTSVENKPTATTAFSDFIEVAGCWWAQRSETRDAAGKLTLRVEAKIATLDAATTGKELESALAARQAVVEVAGDLPAVNQAKLTLLTGKPNFEAAFAVFNHLAETQQWERADEAFEAMRKCAPGKPGFAGLETRYLIMKRRNEEARTRIFAAAKGLSEGKNDHELFLADRLRSEAGSVASAAENFDLLNMLKPIYERAPERLLAMRDWQQAQVGALQGLNRSPEAVILQRQLAEQFAWDANAQSQYANLLSNTNDYQAALAWLDRVMAAGAAQWTVAEIYGFRTTYLSILENQSWLEEVARKTGEWLQGEDVDSSGSYMYLHHLAALIRLDRTDEAYGLIDTWLAEGAATKRGQLDPRTRNRLQAAIGIHLGQGPGIYLNDIPERFHAGLAKVVLAFALDPKEASFAEMVMNDYRFNKTEAARGVRKHFTKVLEQRAAKMPLANLNRLVGWLSANDPAIDKAVWETIVAAVITRWEAERDNTKRDALAATIEGILSRSLGQDRHLAFLRRKLAEADGERRGEFSRQLFEALLGGRWTAETEAEAFGLLYQLAFPPTDVADVRALNRVSALVRLNDWVLRTRVAAAWENVEKQEDLSRTERAAKQAEFVKEAREALATRLAAEPDQRKGEIADALRDWLTAERLYLGVLLRRDPAALAAECWEFLGSHDVFSGKGLEALTWSQAALVERHLASLEYLAARPKADAALISRVLEWLQRGITAHPDDGFWKIHLQRMLVVLDRPQDLKTALVAWTKVPSPERTDWRIALGYLHAELGELGEAVRVFEAVEKDDELGPAEYRVLADWYLLLKREADRERATLARYQAMEEWSLSNLIQQHSNRIANGFNNGVPEDFDPAVVEMFKAIFRKSPNPGNHLSLLGSLYRYTKDFRLLQCLPEGVLGNSAGQIYPFLQNLNQVLVYVTDEAVCDEILTHLDRVRSRVKTRVDARGLDLLEMLVRRKAAEVINQPGQQLPRALEAMQRAFKGDDWGTGERRLMGAFLASLGTIALEPLAAEQRTELEHLYQHSAANTPDRLHLGADYSRCLRGYNRTDQAMAVLSAAIAEYRASVGGVFTQEEQQPFDQWIGYSESDRHFAEGEKRLAETMSGKLPETLRQWLVERRYRLYSNTLTAKGTVSLGEGRELFDNVRKALAKELTTPHHNHRYQLCTLLIGIYRTAHVDAKIEGVPADLVEFAGAPFSELVSYRTVNYQNVVQQLGDTIRQLAGDREALAFLITRYEAEPSAFRATGQGGWSRYGWQLGEYRSRVKDLGPLEPRLLKIVVRELRRDLETGNYSNRSMYHDDHSYFWAEKRSDFLAVAEAVLKERGKVPATIRFVTEYLFHGLEARERAIEVLRTAHDRKLLDESGLSQFADFLERMKRDADAVPLLVELVAMVPPNMDYRRRLIGALGRSGQQAAMVAAVDAAISWAKEHHVWKEASLAPLAQGCHEGRYWDRGVTLFVELIAMHQQTQTNRGVGNGTLSSYYTRLSDCHAGLGQTAAAVDAAAAAIVSWGPRNDQRAQALTTLRNVLAQAKDLKGYIAHLDQVVADSGLENPTVRKALGQIYSERKEFGLAIRQLQLAAETQPEDPETQQLLVAAYDATGDAQAAIVRLIEASHRSPRSIALLRDLGDRLEKLQRPEEAERARTGIIEALPNESEGHAMLAEIRQVQNRWPEAATQWAQVAAIRALEPSGLLNLARAEIRANEPEKAKASAQKVLAREWPSRFGDVHREARTILAELEKK